MSQNGNLLILTTNNEKTV